MIYAIVVTLLSLAGLIILARLDGLLPTEEEPPADGGAGDARVQVAAHVSVPHELIRFVASAAAIVAGGALAMVLFNHVPLRLGIIAVALAVGVALTGILLRVEMRAARSAGPSRGENNSRTRVPLIGSVLRTMSAVGQRLASLASGDEEERSGERDASERFSRVLSSEAEMTKDEEKLLRGAISLPRITVRDVMVPRLGVVGVESGIPWSELLDRVRSSEHSRLPAYKESLDDVVGVIVAKDLLPFAINEEQPENGWEKLIRPASFVPSTKAVADQLREFRNSRAHMAIVVDEYGGTAGILTIEDVLEEVVGEIRDEHDVEEPAVTSEEGGRFWISGRMALDEFEEVLGEHLESAQATTVGGLVFEKFGRIPRVGEQLELPSSKGGTLRVIVERMKRHAVDRIYLERLEHANGSGPGQHSENQNRGASE